MLRKFMTTAAVMLILLPAAAHAGSADFTMHGQGGSAYCQTFGDFTRCYDKPDNGPPELTMQPLKVF